MLRSLIGVLIVAAFLQLRVESLRGQTTETQRSEPPTSDAPSPNPRHGDETPEEAIRSFYTAIAMADRETVEYLLASPKQLQDWIDAQLDITYAFHRFSEAAKSHFGDQGKALYMPAPALVALKQLTENKPKEMGDKAEWTTNPRLPTKLFRKDGHWKLDILGSFEKPEHNQLISKELAKTAAYIDAIAEEMENGQFETIEKVRAELKRRRDAQNSAKQ